jgi:hypothetical protein
MFLKGYLLMGIAFFYLGHGDMIACSQVDRNCLQIAGKE